MCVFMGKPLIHIPPPAELPNRSQSSQMVLVGPHDPPRVIVRVPRGVWEQRCGSGESMP